MLLINCDLGERGVAHQVDDQLVKYIDIANIACGGHAGDQESVDYYTNLCNKNNVKITAHISYPDKENFGRKVIEINDNSLLKSFDEQLALFDAIQAIKPHGALYNELNKNSELAELFVNWCIKNNINEIVTSPFGVVGQLAQAQDISILKESFVERGYMLDENKNPTLIPRGMPNAEIDSVDEALKQFEQLNNSFIDIDGKNIAFNSETICIHSDSSIALELAQKLLNSHCTQNKGYSYGQ
ncbi:5-oxoprolinase subunit PxpA [Francisellaceae bacterium CB300]